MHSFTSLWYKSAPNFSIDNQLDISRPSRYQGKSQLRVKLKQFLHQMGYGDSSSLFRFENGCSVQCLRVTFVRTMRKHKALHCNISVFCFFVFGHLSYKCMNIIAVSVFGQFLVAKC